MIQKTAANLLIYGLLAGLLAGCGTAPIITTTAAVIGASASVCTAIDCLDNENIQVISRECMWYRTVKLSDEGKAGLTRDDKEQIAYNNLQAKENCP